MSERSYTSQEGDGERQDSVAQRDEKATTLADAVEKREAVEKRAAKIVLAAAAFIMVVSFTALAFGLQKVNKVVSQNRVVVCSLVQGYRDQLDSNKKFTKANPNGGTLLGVRFSRGDLDRQRVGLEKRLADLRDAKC